MPIASLDLATGGPARSVPSLGEAINRAGADVQLFVNNKEAEANHDREISPTFLAVKPIRKLGTTVQEARARQADDLLIHTHGTWLPLNHYASVTAQRFNIPLIISPRGMLEPWARSYQSWKKTIAWYLYQRRDLKAAVVLHATSKQEAKNLQFLGFHMPIAVIPNGVDLPGLPESSAKKQNVKTALFLGRIHPVKGLVNFIQAWGMIRPTNWQVVIAGPDEGGHKAEVDLEIQHYELADSITFIGPVTNEKKWEIYSSADLFVLPSHTENFGIVAAEALASGTPVITTTGTPWQELETHNCGWWIDIGVAPLAKALKEAMNLSSEERQAMGRRGRKLVEQNYSWDKIGQEMLAVYKWILEGGVVPDCVMIDSDQFRSYRP